MTKYNDHINRAAHLRADGNIVKARMHEAHAEENYAFGALFNLKGMRQKAHAMFKSADKTSRYKDDQETKLTRQGMRPSQSNVPVAPSPLPPGQMDEADEAPMSAEARWGREENGLFTPAERQAIAERVAADGDWAARINARINAKNGNGLSRGAFTEEGDWRPTAPLHPEQMNAMSKSSEARWGREENGLFTPAERQAIADRVAADGDWAARINARINAKNGN